MHNFFVKKIKTCQSSAEPFCGPSVYTANEQGRRRGRRKESLGKLMRKYCKKRGRRGRVAIGLRKSNNEKRWENGGNVSGGRSSNFKE